MSGCHKVKYAVINSVLHYKGMVRLGTFLFHQCFENCSITIYTCWVLTSLIGVSATHGTCHGCSLDMFTSTHAVRKFTVAKIHV